VKAQTSWYKTKLVALDGFNQIRNSSSCGNCQQTRK